MVAEGDHGQTEGRFLLVTLLSSGQRKVTRPPGGTGFIKDFPCPMQPAEETSAWWSPGGAPPDGALLFLLAQKE